MENTMCSSRIANGKYNFVFLDDEDYGKHNVFFLSSTWEMFVSMCLNKKTVVIPNKKGIYGFFCSNDTVWLDIVL